MKVKRQASRLKNAFAQAGAINPRWWKPAKYGERVGWALVHPERGTPILVVQVTIPDFAHCMAHGTNHSCRRHEPPIVLTQHL